MIAVRLLFSVLVPVVTGGLLIRRLWTAPGGRAIKACLAPLLGLGICSVEFFLWVAIFGHISWHVCLVEIATVILLMLGTRAAPSGSGSDSRLPESELSDDGRTWIRGLYVCFWLAATAGATSFVFLSRESPEGGFDGWDHFAIKARFLLLGADQWKRAFLRVLNDYPDYPLMLPTTMARFWMYLGHETPWVQILLAMLFTFATLALLVTSLSFFRGRQQALLAGLVLLGTPFFITHGAIQYPDVPVGFFFLATFVLLTEARQAPQSFGIIALVGIFASLAAWTKNEGLAFLLLVFVIQAVVLIVREGSGELRRSSLAFAAGALPGLLVLAWFKLHLAPANILVANQGTAGNVARRLLSRSRYLEIGRTFFEQILLSPGFGKWAVNLIPLMLLYGALAGIASYGKRQTSILINAFVVAAMAVTYFMVFVDLPSNLSLADYLIYGLDRLLLQLWPSAVFVFFLCVESPGQKQAEARPAVEA